MTQRLNFFRCEAAGLRCTIQLYVGDGSSHVMVGGVVAYPTANSEPCMRLSSSHGSSTAQPLSRALFCW